MLTSAQVHGPGMCSGCKHVLRRVGTAEKHELLWAQPLWCAPSVAKADGCLYTVAEPPACVWAQPVQDPATVCWILHAFERSLCWILRRCAGSCMG